MSRCLAALAILLMRAVPAAAQPDAGTVFVGAAALAAVERTAQSSDGLSTLYPDLDGTVAGGTLNLGVYLNARWSARVEWALTGELSATVGNPVFPLASTFPGNLRVDAFTTLSVVQSEITYRRETKTGYVLVGYHLNGERASLELVGGLGIVHERRRTRYETRFDIPFPGLLPQPDFETETATYGAAPVVGADVRVRMTDHLALVPAVRVHLISGGMSLRPTAGLRWTF